MYFHIIPQLNLILHMMFIATMYDVCDSLRIRCIEHIRRYTLWIWLGQWPFSSWWMNITITNFWLYVCRRVECETRARVAFAHSQITTHTHRHRQMVCAHRTMRTVAKRYILVSNKMSEPNNTRVSALYALSWHGHSEPYASEINKNEKFLFNRLQ